MKTFKVTLKNATEETDNKTILQFYCHELDKSVAFALEGGLDESIPNEVSFEIYDIWPVLTHTFKENKEHG